MRDLRTSRKGELCRRNIASTRYLIISAQDFPTNTLANSETLEDRTFAHNWGAK